MKKLKELHHILKNDEFLTLRMSFYEMMVIITGVLLLGRSFAAYLLLTFFVLTLIEYRRWRKENDNKNL